MLHIDQLSAPGLCLAPFQRGDNYPDTGGGIIPERRQYRPSAGIVCFTVSIALAWIFCSIVPEFKR